MFAVVLSASAISASDVDVTDSDSIGLIDDTSDVSVPLEKTADSSDYSVSSDSNVDNGPSKGSLSSDEGLESENSNTLSTNSTNYEDLSSENGIADQELLSSEGNISSSVDLSKTIQASSITKYYKGSAKYTATFYDNDGNPLANTNVKITVNGVTYTKKTNAAGVVSMAINLKPGTYKVIAQNLVTGYTLTTNFKILSTITASSISKVYTDGRKFSAKFYKSTGKVLANKYIKFKINGKTYKVKTNAKGVASLSLKTLKKGTYKIISYNTDGLTKTNTVKVYNRVSSSLTASSYTFLKSDSKTIKVKLLNGLGYAPGAGKIVKITINGKTYSKKTNSNGVAALKLPSLNAGLYTVKYKFAGNSFYKASSASSKVAIISTKNPTFTVKSGTSFTYGLNNYFKVAVTAGGVPLVGKQITYTIDGKTYTRTTSNSGIASISIKNLVIGKHTISYSIAKDSKINAKSGSSSVTIKEKPVGTHNAYWLYGADMKSVSLRQLASKGVTDILLNFYAIEAHGKSAVETWIASANSVGIKVHMWVQVFYYGGSWIQPLINGKENTEFFNQKINEIKEYAALKGIAGIHLDYLRYSGSEKNNHAAYQNPGGTEAINSFVKQVRTAIKAINSNLILSCALMPETTSSEYYYGQDYATLSQYMDVVIPMIYKGNYNQKSSWIATTTKWYVENSKGASVWVGLQAYLSDDDVTPLPISEMYGDIANAISGGAAGVVLFRYGVSPDVDFNTAESSASTLGTISIKDIVAGATSLKEYYAKNKKLPSTVTTGGYTFTLPEFLYLMSQAISNINAGKTSAITILKGISAPTSPSGSSISANLYTFANVATNVAAFISTNDRAPNYASSDVGNIKYDDLVDIFSRVLAFYGTNGRLPSYVSINTGGSDDGGGGSPTGTGINEKVTESDLSKYLKATTNCQVGAAAIKAIVDSVTKGKTTAKEKAVAIYNYVRDNIAYSFYYNTKYGATGTLSAKQGNCVDKAHLVIAMFRTAGLAARYVHGTCKFSSGSTYGHVWAQVAIDGQWYIADTTSSRNSLGTVNNWNTKTFSLNGIYVSLSF